MRPFEKHASSNCFLEKGILTMRYTATTTAYIWFDTVCVKDMIRSNAPHTPADGPSDPREKDLRGSVKGRSHVLH